MMKIITLYTNAYFEIIEHYDVPYYNGLEMIIVKLIARGFFMKNKLSII